MFKLALEKAEEPEIKLPTPAGSPHSSILAWETPWTEEPGGLQSKG